MILYANFSVPPGGTLEKKQQSFKPPNPNIPAYQLSSYHGNWTTGFILYMTFVSTLCFIIVRAFNSIPLSYDCMTAINMPSVSSTIVAEAFKEGHNQQAVCTWGNSDYTNVFSVCSILHQESCSVLSIMIKALILKCLMSHEAASFSHWV